MPQARIIALSATTAAMARLVNQYHHLYDVFYLILTLSQPVIDFELSRAYPEVWKAMEQLVDNGKAKSIGESIPQGSTYSD